MQDINGRSGARLANALVNAHFLPAFEQAWLILRQIGLHGEIPMRQIEAILQIKWQVAKFSRCLGSFDYKGIARPRVAGELMWVERLFQHHESASPGTPNSTACAAAKACTIFGKGDVSLPPASKGVS